MIVIVDGEIYQKVDIGSNWTTNNPVLKNKQLGFDSTAKAFKVGDAVTAWNDLDYYYGTSVTIPDTISAPIGTTLPIEIDYATNYSEHGDYPTIQIRLITGQDITSTATIIYGSAIPLDTISINAADDGTGVTDAEILIIIKN